MSKLYISEYAELPVSKNGQLIQAPIMPSITTQVVTFTTSTQSSAFNASTKFVRIHSDAICSFLFGTNPTATTSSPRMVAGATEYFAVSPGLKVAVIDNT